MDILEKIEKPIVWTSYNSGATTGEWRAWRNIDIGVNEVQLKYRTSDGAVIHIGVYESLTGSIMTHIMINGRVHLSEEELSDMNRAIKEASSIIERGIEA